MLSQEVRPEMSAGLYLTSFMKDASETYLPPQQVSESQTAVITCADVSYISGEKEEGHYFITWLHTASLYPILVHIHYNADMK